MQFPSEFPILDLAGFNSDFKKFAEDLYAASNRWGFLVITNSGIDPGEIFDLVSYLISKRQFKVLILGSHAPSSTCPPR